MPYVVSSECILCGACESGCEVEAISEGDTQMHIDPEVCVECGTCARNCPVEAINFEDEPVEKK
jgi:ferredoxin